MIRKLIEKIFGTKNSKTLKKLSHLVNEVNSFRPTIQSLTDEELQSKTLYFRELLKQGKTLNDILPEAYAVVREASRRIFAKEHYDEQIYGGVVLHRGMISEMKTGEGKTLVSLLPSYLNALAGHVHIITSNEYLAKRDAISMGKVHQFLGLSVSYIYNNMSKESRQSAYMSDITYGTASEFAFDYLRDNGENSKQDMCQQGHNFALIDEIDNILIDEAGTPCIISGMAELLVDGEEVDLGEYLKLLQAIIFSLNETHYEIDHKDRAIFLTDDGMTFVEDTLKQKGLLPINDSLYDFKNKNLQHYVYQLLKANYLFKKNVEYVVEKGKIIIVDESTGRKMYGRQYSEGLHQAIEAKEGVEINPETQTFASVTLQNYFRMYTKLAGMTGTALTEATEFREIYGLDIVAIPTHKKMIRKDFDDEIYRTFREKTDAICRLVKDCLSRQQPVLLGTVSVEKSEIISEIFTKNGIPHEVLNAKNHEKEAEIIANAGMPGAVTIATNMAGRGTDIQLGGNAEMIFDHFVDKNPDLSYEEIQAKKVEIYNDVQMKKELVLASGGLYVIGTERHESRRIDNQLRGRSGRQGDKGCSKFFLSLEDDLMKMFGSDRLDSMLQKLGLQEGEVITHPWINKSIEKAQEKVEARNYSSRKNLLKYDEVMNFERTTIYNFRNNIIDKCNFSASIREICDSAIMSLINKHIPEDAKIAELDLSYFQEDFTNIFGNLLSINDFIEFANNKNILKDHISIKIFDKISEFEKQQQDGDFDDHLTGMYKRVVLRELDKLWRSHLLTTDHLRRSIHFRSYGQKDPLIEYKTESFQLFNEMLDSLNFGIVKAVFNEWIMHGNMSNVRQVNDSLNEPSFDDFNFDPEKLEELMKAMFGDFMNNQGSTSNKSNNNLNQNDLRNTALDKDNINEGNDLMSKISQASNELDANNQHEQSNNEGDFSNIGEFLRDLDEKMKKIQMLEEEIKKNSTILQNVENSHTNDEKK